MVDITVLDTDTDMVVLAMVMPDMVDMVMPDTVDMVMPDTVDMDIEEDMDLMVNSETLDISTMLRDTDPQYSEIEELRFKPRTGKTPQRSITEHTIA